LTRVDRDVAEVGDVAMKSQAYDAAVLAFGRAAILVPDNVAYQEKLAVALEHAGDRDRARSVLKKLLGLVPESEREDIQNRIDNLEDKLNGDG